MNTELVEGLKDLKKGALLNLLGVLFVFLGMGAVIATVGFAPMKEVEPEKFVGMMAILGVFALLFLVAVILSLISFVMYFMATGHLKNYDEKYGIGRLGLILEIIGVLLILIPLLFALATAGRGMHEGAMFGAFMAVIGFVFLGAIALIVGAVLFGVMLMRLGDVESDFKVAGVLYFVGMILSFFTGIIGAILGIATTILIYVSANSALKRISAEQT